MDPRLDADILVVGAGPAGSVTALLLARRGYRVTIVDKAKFPRPKPCGEYLNPSAVAVLHRLGIGPDIEPLGTTLSGMFIAGIDGMSVWAPFSSGRGLLVPRQALDHALLREADRAGAQVIEQFSVAGVTTGSPASVDGRHLGRPARLTARLVIGADGIRSAVARRAGPLVAASDGHYTVGAHFENLNVQTPRGDLHLGRGWYAGAALYGGGIGNIVVAVPRAVLRQGKGDLEAIFARACAGLPSLSAIVRGARRLAPFVSAGPLGYTRRRAVDDGLLLVGDAAGTINPMTGEGIAVALRGAALAADAADRALQRGQATQAALSDYERSRAAAFGDTWRVSRMLQWLVRRPGLAASLFPRLAGDPRLAARLLGVVSGVRPARDIVTPGFLARLLAAPG